MILSDDEKNRLRKLNDFENLKWYIEERTLSHGKSFGGFDSKVDGFDPACHFVTISDCHLAVLEKRDFIRVEKRIDQETTQKRLTFFKEHPYFKDIGQMLIKKIIGLFKNESFKLGDLLY